MTLRPRATVFALLSTLTLTSALAQAPAPAVTPAATPAVVPAATAPVPSPAQVPMIEKPAAKAVAAPEPKGMITEPAPAAKAAVGADESGLAAVYNDKLHGRKTASGKRYDRNAMTAAHKTLPFGTQVRVTNTKNKKSVVLTINDRGPFHAGRILDISPRAAKALGISPRGMADVTMMVVGRGKS